MERKAVYIATLVFVGILALTAKSLWRDESEMFLDRVPGKKGEPIKIVFNHATVVSYKSVSKGSKEKRNGKVTSKADLLSFLPAVDFADAGESAVESETESEGEFTGAIMGTIADVLPSGMLSIAANHTIIVNGEVEQVVVSGTVSPKSVRRGGYVYSTDIMDARIVYAGTVISKKGPLEAGDVVTVTNLIATTNVTTSTVGGARVFVTNIVTNEEVSLRIRDNAKQKIILDYLNGVLGALFR